MSTMNDRGRLKTAFVFAGGGSFGAIQVGMLKALSERGIVPDLVVGSSVGALNAAHYAGQPTPGGVAQLENVWRRLRRDDVFPITWRSLWRFVKNGDVLVASDGLRRLCRDHLQFRNLEQARLPLHVVATDVLSGEPVIISDGAAEDAIVASAAIPAAFEPVRVKSKYLADGAITSNTPIQAAVALGARRLVVLSTGHPNMLDVPPRGAIEAALHALTLLIARQLHSELAGLNKRIQHVIVPAPSPLHGSPYDFSRTGEFIDRAAETAALWLDHGGLDFRAGSGVPKSRLPIRGRLIEARPQLGALLPAPIEI